MLADNLLTGGQLLAFLTAHLILYDTVCVLCNYAEGGEVPLVPKHSLEVAWTDARHRPLAAGLYNITRTNDIITNIGEERIGKSLTGFIARVEANNNLFYFPMVQRIYLYTLIHMHTL